MAIVYLNYYKITMIPTYITKSKTKKTVIAPDGTDSVGVYMLALTKSNDNTIKKVAVIATDNRNNEYFYYIEPLSSWNLGNWNYQVIAHSNTNGDKVIDAGTFNVILSLKDAAALGVNTDPFDSRSQTEKDLDDVESAIRELVSGRASSYTISGRQFNKLNIKELRMIQSQLLKKVNAELESKGFPLRTYGNARIINFNFV